MIDLHTHVLPGLDDGAATLEDALAIARASAADGVRVLVGTPHVRGDFPTTAAAMEAELRVVRAAVAAEGLDVEVRGGGEIAVARLWGGDDLPPLGEAELDRFGLGGTRVTLLEFPYDGWPDELPRAIARLVRAGRVPVVAHPERSGEVHADPSRVGALVEAGALVQLTAASVDGRLGRETARCARRLLELGLAHVVASDAHGVGVREAGLSGARDAVGGDLGRWLVDDVPAALLAGEAPPPRPAAAGRRRAWWRRAA